MCCILQSFGNPEKELGLVGWLLGWLVAWWVGGWLYNMLVVCSVDSCLGLLFCKISEGAGVVLFMPLRFFLQEPVLLGAADCET